MPAPNHYQITFSGVIGQSATDFSEIWAMGVSMGNNPQAAFTDANVALIAPLADAARQAWITHLSPRITGNCHLTRTRVAYIGDNGRTLLTQSGAYAHVDNETVAAGAALANYMPPQLAAVVTLQSAMVGPTGRGRFYVPCPTGDFGVDGALTAASQSAWLNSAVAFIKALNVAGDGMADDPEVVVASGGSLLKGINPGLRPVQQVRMGRVLDTQTRRRNGLLEGYVTAAV